MSQEVAVSVNAIQAELSRHNASHRYAFDLSVSMGYSVCEYGADQSVDDVVKRADTMMYLQKAERKTFQVATEAE